MRLRTSAQFQNAADALAAEHHLDVGSIKVVASWFNPVPMVVHRSSRMTEMGDVLLALVLILIARSFPLGAASDLAVALVCSFLFSWFGFRVYYDFRFGQSERMILIPPTASDHVLLHELLHVHLGHIRKRSVAHRLLAMSRLGPFEYGVRVTREDYGGEGVVGELHERTRKNLHGFLVSPGLATFVATSFVLFVLLIAYAFG